MPYAIMPSALSAGKGVAVKESLATKYGAQRAQIRSI